MHLKWKEFSSSYVDGNKTIKNMAAFHEYYNKNKAVPFNLLTWIAVCVHCMIKSSSEDEEGKNLPKYDLSLQ